MLKGLAAAILTTTAVLQAQTASSQEPFRWGTASAAYQVEGADTADNKGASIWDVYLDEDHLAGPDISGKVAINFYDRNQYLKDIRYPEAHSQAECQHLCALDQRRNAHRRRMRALSLARLDWLESASRMAKASHSGKYT